MRTLPRSGFVAAMSLMFLAISSSFLTAQQKSKDTQACVARVLPTSVPAGVAASRLTVTLSEAIGNVTKFTPDEDAGLALASSQDLPKTAMGREGAAPKPIEMVSDVQRRLTLWLNTGNAKAGDYHFTLTGASGTCAGTLKVTGQS